MSNGEANNTVEVLEITSTAATRFRLRNASGRPTKRISSGASLELEPKCRISSQDVAGVKLG
jgi:hypothetical protein